ncbi:MFS transporter [Sinobacterium caligoides]|uniref:MFS transporter n=1 Tax=Sinobacterium caligoides TaxID=933926 RepID=A0A3N2DKM8_9GAMM|nr:MFS transporter [Sinobacterium caligoides]ROS00239.1 MFS transporter [Sinobacterium caligoides]
MSLKHSLILLTLISVVADTMLLPFYPQFFQQAFAVDNPEHVGFYIAACCFTVMTALPLWAKVARHVHELHLWVYTQVAAACLGLFCYQTESLVAFWIASQLMLVFKASYLLIYPFVMRLEEKEQHLKVVGLFSVLMHFGAIGGAILGGFALQFYQPQDIYLIMVGSDITQVLLCLYLIRLLATPWRAHAQPAEATENGSSRSWQRSIVFRLSVVSMLFYFSAFLIRPFFVSYWQSISQLNSELYSAIAYSIPAWVALYCLWLSHRRPSSQSHFAAICVGGACAIAGLFLQGSGEAWWVAGGRLLFGYAMYQITVRLEVLLFENSDPERYGDDFSKVHFFQNLGVIFASFSVGYIVDSYGPASTFTIALVGFTIATICFFLFFRTLLRTPSTKTTTSPNNAHTSGELTS